jgi:CelD/BcsL family acetyltransferase involved in cellulose biosynthesis
MQITIVDSFEQLEKLKQNWNAAYSADAHATIFMSWPWLRGWCDATPYKWLVLACRPHNVSEYVAFMVLGLHSIQRKKFFLIRRLHAGGNPWSDHAGFVCVPEYAEKAIPAFAHYVENNLKWDTFHMMSVFDPRLEMFLSSLSTRRLYVTKLDDTPCPYIPLPNSWEVYSDAFLTKRYRKEVAYCIRKMKRNIDYRITNIQEDNHETQIETLLSLYQLRRGQQSEQNLDRFRSIYHHCFRNDRLWLDVIYDGVTPVAGLSAFLDPQKSTFSAYSTGFDQNYIKLSPGRAIFVHSIRYAIENGFQTYDFLRGAEDYKYSWGSKDRFNTNLIITRQAPIITMKNMALRLADTLPLIRPT